VLVDTLPFSLTPTQPTSAPQPPETPHATEDFGRRAHLLAGNVTVVTSNDDEDWFGLTSASVCPLSSEPPTVVACLTRRSRLARELGRTRRFCINVLGPDQIGVADSFADPLGSATDQFVDVGWQPGTTGTPVLTGAVAAFECEVDLIYSYPRDLIVVGSVRHVTSHGLDNGRQGPVGPVHRDLIVG
jgi:flavin reductase (DIM6/NTAB) family NADH-FMN oxidoreductase RutF